MQLHCTPDAPRFAPTAPTLVDPTDYQKRAHFHKLTPLCPRTFITVPFQDGRDKFEGADCLLFHRGKAPEEAGYSKSVALQV